MKKKNEVIEILARGGYILVDSIYRTARVYEADGENGDTCRYDVAERLGQTDGYKKTFSRGWSLSWFIEKEGAQRSPMQEQERAVHEELKAFAVFVDALSDDVMCLVPDDVIREIWTNASSPERAVQNCDEYAETIKAERAEEERRAGAEKRATACSSTRRVYWNTRTQERAESAKTALQWHRAGDDVRIMYENNAGGIYRVSVIKGAEQDAPRDENWEHCKHISDELDKYADGIMYTCPDCGQVIEMPDDVGDKYRCPCCGCVDEVDEYNQLSVYDFFVDTYDIEYRCDGSREYRSACIMVACGGPNIYIDTGSGAVELYWWTESAKYHLRSDTKDAVDDWAREMWECC
jgi:predicted RNA-binding Zn-ribbon protein involved in translation (DUF1610 family)